VLAFDGWLERLRRFWGQRLDALGTELARGRRERRRRTAGPPAEGHPSATEDGEET
jgi:hypothetical protein